MAQVAHTVKVILRLLWMAALALAATQTQQHKAALEQLDKEIMVGQAQITDQFIAEAGAEEKVLPVALRLLAQMRAMAALD